MYILDFVIPLNRDELSESSSAAQFTVSSVYSVAEIRERLEATKTALNEEGTEFIVDHFTTFFSIFKNFKQVPDLVVHKALTILLKAFKLLSANVNILLEDIANIDAEVQRKVCNITKMIVYALIELMKLLQDQHTDQSNMVVDAKGKKKQSKPLCEGGWDWYEERNSVLIEMYNFLQLPLKMLWDPPVVEEEFVNLISNFCYKCLEDQQINALSCKPSRDTMFQILGSLINNYLHGISFCVKAVQLLRLHEHLVKPFAQGVVLMIRECQCKNVVKEIVREISNTDCDQLAADSNGTRSLNLFLVQVTEEVPDMVIPAIDLLTSHLAGNSYTMRICVIGVLGEIVHTTLTKESLDEDNKRMRDEFLNVIQEHMHDSNAFVRTKVLQVWQKLCLAKAIPISRLNLLLELTISRLNDKSTNVKKQAVLLVKALLEGNPYSAQLNAADIRNQFEEEKKKLKILREENRVQGSCGTTPWTDVAHEIKQILQRFSDDSDSDTEAGQDEACTVQGAIKEICECFGKRAYESAVRIIMRLKKEFYDDLGVEDGEDGAVMTVLQKIYEDNTSAALADVSPEVLERLDKLEKTTSYLEQALNFALLIDRALPVLLTFLDSNVVSEVLESIHFFASAYLFGFHQALEGVRKMLYLVLSKEPAVKAAVSTAYKELYFQTNSGARADSVQAVKSLSELVLKLNAGQLDALEEVVREWVKTGVIDKNCIQVMFERFSLKMPGTTEAHSWAALVLIRMVGAEEPKVIKSNVSVLLEQGLGDRGCGNLLLAKEACRALERLLPVKQPGKPADQSLRYPAEHEMFRYLLKVLKGGLWRLDDPHYIPMAEAAVNMVFVLCQHPDTICETLIVDLHEKIRAGKKPWDKKQGKVLSKNVNFDDLLTDDTVESGEGSKEPEKCEGGEEDDKLSPAATIQLLTRFIAILGQVAANYILFLEGPVLDELKRRNQLEYERKLRKYQENKKFNVSRKGNASRLESGQNDDKNMDAGVEDLEFNRVAADDMDADEMKRKTEFDIMVGDGLLGRFVPLVLAVCRNPGRYNNAALQNAALLTMSKFMLVSSRFCEEHLQLLVTLCEKSHNPHHRLNAMVALGALQYRFPNSLEPWTPHMYGMLRDPDTQVRHNSVMVITDLIVNEMIKARSHISDLAVCIVDKDIRIAQTTRHFFREYAEKGNSLYNILPSLISNLTQPNPVLSEEDFKKVMQFILGLITKDKQSEYLVEKLCLYLESATTERQWRELAFCLSLLSYTDKGLRKLLENLRCFASKLYLAEVYECFFAIQSNLSRNPQKDKALVDELGAVIKEYRDKSCEDKNVVVPAASKRCPPSTVKKRLVRRKLASSSSEDNEDDLEGGAAARRERRVKKGLTYATADEGDNEAFVSETASTKKKAPLRGKQISAASSDSDEQPRKQTRNQGRQTGKKKKGKAQRADVSSSDEEPARRQVRSTRKRK